MLGGHALENSFFSDFDKVHNRARLTVGKSSRNSSIERNSLFGRHKHILRRVRPR